MSENKLWRYSIMKDNCLQAVHDDDLSVLLTSLGIFDTVRDGQCNCLFCSKVISLENLGAIIPLNGNIVFSCDSHICLNSMAKAGDEDDGKRD